HGGPWWRNLPPRHSRVTVAGMATIRKRTTRQGTKWQVQVRRTGYPPLTGTFATKEEARRWATAREGEFDAGQPVQEAPKRTVAEALDAYEDSVEYRNLRATTQRRREFELRWWRDRIGDLKLSALTAAVIGQQRDALLKGQTPTGRKASPASTNRYLAGLSAVIQFAVEELGWLENNPVRRVRKPAEPPGRDRFLTDDEFWRLLAACEQSPNPRLKPLVLAALSSGARLGELLGLPWSAVDLERGTAAIPRSKNNSPKTLFFSGMALDELRRWREEQPAAKIVFAPKPGEWHRPRAYFENALSAAGIEDFRFHDLRHTAATWLAMLGASGPELAAFLGHKTLAMVARYTHLARSYRSAVAPRLVSRLLGSGLLAEPGVEGLPSQVQPPALPGYGSGQAVAAPVVQPATERGHGNPVLATDGLGTGPTGGPLGGDERALEPIEAQLDGTKPLEEIGAEDGELLVHGETHNRASEEPQIHDVSAAHGGSRPDPAGNRPAVLRFDPNRKPRGRAPR
ncbi:MAG: site-specific integrase, partial [Thermoanaerobaculia bacterium]|nr:site-specific integrase [Thermoanaerobaculia bacterium]